jgi:hypothetical protein
MITRFISILLKTANLVSFIVRTLLLEFLYNRFPFLKRLAAQGFKFLTDRDSCAHRCLAELSVMQIYMFNFVIG